MTACQTQFWALVGTLLWYKGVVASSVTATLSTTCWTSQTLHLLYLCAFLHFSPSPYWWTLYLGRETQTITGNPNEVISAVELIITHPDYNKETFNYDIALMKLSAPVTFTEYIRPICLSSSTSSFHNATDCWASGWGNVNQGGRLLGHFFLKCTN